MRSIARLLLPAAALALAACDTATTAPTAARASATPRMSNGTAAGDYRVPVGITGVNDCTGETITGTAQDHVVYIDVVDAAYGYNSSIKQQFSNMKLTGSFGSSYVGNMTSDTHYGANQGGVYTFEMKATLIGQGTTPNEVVHAAGHNTVNANGTITADFDRFELVCQ